MAGTFQVYGIEGASNKTPDGFFTVLTDSRKLIFDRDFAGLEAADMKYRELIDQAIKEGFIKTPKIS